MNSTIIQNKVIKIYLYLNENSFYIYTDSKFNSYRPFLNVAGVQNAGEMPL